MKGRSVVHQLWGIATIVKIPKTVLHIPDGPLRNFHGKRRALRVTISKEKQGINRL
jgi:hypothetical protein